MAAKPSIVALIPARAGSKRVPGKNVRLLHRHPLIAYTIAPALQSGVFDAVIVSTDSEETAAIARHYGAEVPFMRPAEFAGDTSPDIEWLEFTLTRLRDEGRSYDCFSLLRPTSPFRTPETLRRAWEAFLADGRADSLRAVEKCTQHPAKMWVVRHNRLLSILPFGPEAQPWHSSQYQSLPVVFVQNASLEMAWSRVVFDSRTIAGEVIVPFFSDELEGFDINNRFDWIVAEHLLQTGEARLPDIPQPAWQGAAR
ncbi:MAG: acylneuraminate cytidylyltransferase family protein [Acidobacteriota bacterium]